MRKKIEVEEKFCDVCGKECLYTCFICETDFCSEHKKENMVDYHVDPRFGNEEHVCIECNKESDDERLALLKELDVEIKRRRGNRKKENQWDEVWVKKAYKIDPKIFMQWR